MTAWPRPRAIEREREGDDETRAKAPPEQRLREPGVGRGRHHHDEGVIHDPHDGDRSGVRGKGEGKRATQRHAGTVEAVEARPGRRAVRLALARERFSQALVIDRRPPETVLRVYAPLLTQSVTEAAAQDA